jgi:cobalt-zinc-cadmium efflux system membrane fusion protein
MKKRLIIAAVLMAGVIMVQAQTCATGDCNCASCVAKNEGKFTLPGLQGLEEQGTGSGEQDELAGHDHGTMEEVHDAPEGHDHEAEIDEQAGHDQKAEIDDHAGHDHSAHAEEGAGVLLSAEMAKKIGLQIHEAEGGQVSRSVVFPAEIKLNRDRSAAVSPRYASIVRQVFAEIGDAVKKGDVLASLENRETLAVYTVSAPLDGIVVSKHVSIGESAGEERVLYEVADLSSVWADISIFPQYRHQIEKGQRVLLSASDGHCVETAIEYISPLVATDTRTLQARCVLEGAADDFTPGAFVRAEVAVETVEANVRVEKDAVQTLEGRPVVFIADEQDFESRDVELGLSDRRFVEIKAGLAPGEKYVAKGAFELKAEMVTSGLDPHAGHGH